MLLMRGLQRQTFVKKTLFGRLIASKPALAFRSGTFKTSSTCTRRHLSQRVWQIGRCRANMSTGMGSDPRSKVIVSVAIASCVIGTVGYLKYVQSEGNTGPYIVNKIIEHANRTSVVQEIVGSPVVLEGFIKSTPATSTEGEKISFYVKGPGGSAGQRVKLHACGRLVGDQWQQDSAHLELSNGDCVAIPTQPNLGALSPAGAWHSESETILRNSPLEPTEVKQQAPDKPNYLFMVAVAFGLGVGIAVALNRILHRRAGATGTVPDAVFALARQHVSESPAVIRALGAPVSCKTSYLYTDDRPQLTDDFARFSFDVSGPQGSAVAQVMHAPGLLAPNDAAHAHPHAHQLQAVRDTEDVWTHTHLSVEVDGGRKIVLPTGVAGSDGDGSQAIVNPRKSRARKRRKRVSKKKRK